MSRHRVPSHARTASRRLAALGVAGVLGIAGISFAPAAAVAVESAFNPFSISGGFSIVARGDIQLNNAEIEGSVAAFGTVSSGNQNGYPVIHKAAGMADYAVPTVDGVPVRILAGGFSGSGALDISNRDDSNTLAAGAPEKVATIRLASVDGLSGQARGGGTGPAAGKDFLRIVNLMGGVLDIKTVPYAGASVTDFQTELPAVADYFGDVEARISAVDTCLASLYDPSTALANVVTVEAQGDMVFVSDLANDRPNIIDYAAVAGKTIKLDRARGYTPTAAAPLVVRVPAGTALLGQLRFEGWSSSASAPRRVPVPRTRHRGRRLRRR